MISSPPTAADIEGVLEHLELVGGAFWTTPNRYTNAAAVIRWQREEIERLEKLATEHVEQIHKMIDLAAKKFVAAPVGGVEETQNGTP